MKLAGRWWAPGLVAGTTLLVHGGVFLGLGAPGSFRKYLLAAEQQLAGTLPAERLMDFSPLYLALCRFAVRWLPAPETLLVWGQVFGVSIAAGLLVLWLRRRFTMVLAVTGGLVFLLHPPLLVYELILEPEVLQLLLLLAFLVLMGARFRGHDVVAGVAAALSVANRPSLLPLFLLVPLYFLLRERGALTASPSSDQSRAASGSTRSKSSGRKASKRTAPSSAAPNPDRDSASWWRRTWTFGLPVVTMLLLLAIRASKVTGDPRTPVMNPGTVFFEGNHPLSHGLSATYPPVVLNLTKYENDSPDAAHELYRQVARAGAGEDLSVREVNSYWAGRATAFLADHPGVALSLWSTKLFHILHRFEWHDIRNAWAHERRIPWIGLPWALLSTLALAGMVLERRRWRASLLVYGIAGLQIAVMVVFYVSARQRLVLLVPFVYFALVVVEQVIRSRRSGWLWAGAAILLSLPLFRWTDPMRDHTDLRVRHLRHEGLKQQVEMLDLDFNDAAALRTSSERLVDALAEVPWLIEWSRPPYFPNDRRFIDLRMLDRLDGIADASPSVRFDRAVLRLPFPDEVEAARSELNGLVGDGTGFLRGSHRSSSPEFFLGLAALRDGEPATAPADARPHFHAALERTPADPFVLAQLVALGEPQHRETLVKYYGEIDTAWLVGQAWIPRDPAAAVKELQSVVAAMPRFRDAHMFLAAALAAAGRHRDAAMHYQQGVALRESPVRVPGLSPAFRSLFQSSTGNLNLQRFCAEAMLHGGDFRGALDILQRLQVPEAQRAELAGRIEWVRATLAADS